MKYLLDIILLILILPISMIVLPLISILILILDSQPVFYSQYRVGLNGKEFKLYKFRTMAESSDESIHEDHYKNLSSNKNIQPSLSPDDPIRIENDDRITTIERFLRKTSLDELPNIINVLYGQMSFVGPMQLVTYDSD